MAKTITKHTYAFHVLDGYDLSSTIQWVNVVHPEWDVFQFVHDSNTKHTKIFYRTASKVPFEQTKEGKELAYLKDLIMRARPLISKNDMTSELEGATYKDAINWLNETTKVLGFSWLEDNKD